MLDNPVDRVEGEAAVKNVLANATIGTIAIWATTFLVTQVYAQQLDPGAPSTQPVQGFRSVDIGGRSLRYQCYGTGSPTVIVEPGGGTSLETVFSWNRPIGWAIIIPEIAKTTTICAYDRAGLGRSDKAPLPRTSLDVAKDLRALIERAGLKPPFVLAGQSFGGMNARMFAHLYPEAVAGLVLIDSSHPDAYPEVSKVLPARAPSDKDYALVKGWREGPDLSKSREWIDLKANADLVRATGGIGDKPLIVLTQSPQWNDPYAPDDIEPLIDAVSERLQAGLTALSTNSKQIVASKAGHNIQADEPQLVIDAIVDVVAQVRLGATAQQSHETLALAQKFTLHSDILKEDRPYWVSLPSSYGTGAVAGRKYPVLYLLDGRAHLNAVNGVVHHLSSRSSGAERIPEMIVVALMNTKRSRDFTPTHMASGPYSEGSGGASAFLHFMKEELIPEIESHYRASAERTLVGHSLGGLLALSALFDQPELFSHYIAIDPSLFWDDTVLIKQLRQNSVAKITRPTSVFIAGAYMPPYPAEAGAKQIHDDALDQFQSLMEARRSASLRVQYRYFEDETHLSVPLIAVYRGLLFACHGYEKPAVTGAK